MLPNLISLGRIVLIAPIVVLYPNSHSETSLIVLGLIIFSYLTDFLDGFLARKLGMQTRLGLILDPLADKLWTMVMIFLLVKYRDLEVWIGLTIVSRDVWILIINSWVLWRRMPILPSDELGRKYMVICGLMIIGMTMNLPGMIWLAYLLILLSPITLIVYTRRILRMIEKPPSTLSATDSLTE